jgi:acid stress-induced BolA-like protein IbaG/YrbA
MFEATEIERLIAAGLECDFLQIEGDDGTHFTGIVVSPAFEGKRGCSSTRPSTPPSAS